MFTPLTHIATALSFFMSGQLMLPSVASGWVIEPARHRCTSASHDHWGKKAASTKPIASPGPQASRSIQIVTFGP
jgi:hypothetical protein